MERSFQIKGPAEIAAEFNTEKDMAVDKDKKKSILERVKKFAKDATKKTPGKKRDFTREGIKKWKDSELVHLSGPRKARELERRKKEKRKSHLKSYRKGNVSLTGKSKKKIKVEAKKTKSQPKKYMGTKVPVKAEGRSRELAPTPATRVPADQVVTPKMSMPFNRERLREASPSSDRPRMSVPPLSKDYATRTRTGPTTTVTPSDDGIPLIPAPPTTGRAEGPSVAPQGESKLSQILDLLGSIAPGAIMNAGGRLGTAAKPEGITLPPLTPEEIRQGQIDRTMGEWPVGERPALPPDLPDPPYHKAHGRSRGMTSPSVEEPATIEMHPAADQGMATQMRFQRRKRLMELRDRRVADRIKRNRSMALAGRTKLSGPYPPLTDEERRWVAEGR